MTNSPFGTQVCTATVDRLTAESASALVAAVEAKDPFTRHHSLTVASMADALGRRMELAPRLLETLRLSALLHDVGKIAVPDTILSKSGPLTDDEFKIVKTHPQQAVKILKPMSYLEAVRRIVHHHHERFDGTGYPRGVRGSRIPLLARILSVADAMDAMLSPRCYKEAYELPRVQEELSAGAGRQFDPDISKLALRWLQSPNAPAGP